jgi:hypothetical protein
MFLHIQKVTVIVATMPVFKNLFRWSFAGFAFTVPYLFRKVAVADAKRTAFNVVVDSPFRYTDLIPVIGEDVVDRLALVKKRSYDIANFSPFFCRCMWMLPGSVKPDF